MGDSCNAAGTANTTDDASRLDDAMNRYARGDDDAFGEIYDRLAQRLMPFLVTRTRDRGRAEDLLQQTMLNIHRARGLFNGTGALVWAFAIARRLLIDDHRRRRRDVTLHADRELDDRHLSSDDDADGLAIARQTAELLDARLRDLPANQREAFDLVRQRGLTPTEAAKLLGTTAVAVKLRTHRASVALRGALGADAARA